MKDRTVFHHVEYIKFVSVDFQNSIGNVFQNCLKNWKLVLFYIIGFYEIK